ncbi:MAG: hypothetical protein WDW38_008269 [Sanguina aurantia]
MFSLGFRTPLHSNTLSSLWCLRTCAAAPAARHTFYTSSSSRQQDPADASQGESDQTSSSAPAPSDAVETHSQRAARLAAHPRTAGALRLMEEEKVQAMGSHEKRMYTQKLEFNKVLSSHKIRMDGLLNTRYQGWSVAALISHRVQQRRTAGSN